MNELIHTTWRDNAQQVRYPFIDSATLVGTGGRALPQDLLIDASVAPLGGEARLYLNRVTVTGPSMTFAVAGPVVGELASATVDLNTTVERLALIDVFGRPAGVLVVDLSLLPTALAALGEGTTTFEVEASEFCASVAVPMPSLGVLGVVTDDGGLLTGDVVLVGEDGVVLSVEDGALRVDVLGDPYAFLAACLEEGVAPVEFCGLKTINHIPSNAQGDFLLRAGANAAGDPVLRFYVSEGQITVTQVGGKSGLDG